MNRKIRAEENALLIWDGAHARTAYLDGKEQNALLRWAEGEENGFAERLKKLGFIGDEDREKVRNAVREAKKKKAPLRSFCAPESLHIELTERCSLRCPQCYKTLSSKELPFQRLEELLQQAADMQVFQIALGGGEPLLYSHLNESILRIAQFGMACSITTSGRGLNFERLKEMKRLGLNHIQISLNGSTEEIHERSRDGFSDAVDALKLLKHTEISYGINWVARMDNIDDFPALIEQAKEFGAHNINILRYKPSEHEDYLNVRLTQEKMKFLEKIIKQTNGIPLEVDSAFSCLLCHLNGRAGVFSGCGAGRRFLAVDVDGFFRPCSHVPFRENGADIGQIWYHSPILSQFRGVEDVVGEPCRSCQYLSGCGSCRAITLFQSKTLDAGDKECWFQV